MPQLIASLVAMAFVYYALRWVSRDIQRVEAALRRIHRRLVAVDASSAQVLQADPATGIYRLPVNR